MSEVTPTSPAAVTTPAPSAPAPSAAAAPAPTKSGAISGFQGLKDKAAQAKASADASGTSVGDAIGGDAPLDPSAPPAFTPNYKFKVHDEEKEIDEFFRGLIKDEESEKKVKEIFGKAYALDAQKAKNEQVREQFSEVSQKYGNIDKSLKQLSRYVQNKDLGSFFEAVQIPEHMVFEFVKQRLAQMEAPPEQRAEMQRIEQERKQFLTLQQENEELKERYSSETVQARGLELDTALSSPGVSTITEKFDASLGKGAFKKAVIDHGIVTYQMTGKEIPVYQAVQETAARWQGLFAQSQQAASEQIQASAQAQTSAMAPPPTMPNVSGRSTSPIKSGPRSIDDLKKLAQARA